MLAICCRFQMPNIRQDLVIYYIRNAKGESSLRFSTILTKAFMVNCSQEFLDSTQCW